jgi:aminoglycoside phosphotransferase (APT) family kinase protein
MDWAQTLAERIREWEEADSVEIRDLERVTTGASRQTWLFTAVIRKAGSTREQPMVLRKDPKVGLSYSSRAEEFAVLRKAFEHGIPVPRPLYQSDTALDTPFFIMERVFGETYPKRLLNDERYAATRDRWAYDLGRILARIHRIPLTEDLAFLKRASVLEQIERNESIWRATKLNDSPVLEFAFRYLKTHIPPNPPTCFLHADFRMGNILFDESGVKAILDWELAQTGDPMYDIAVICMKSWRFDKPENRVGGFGREEDLFRGYEEAGGFPIDRDRIRYWEILANCFWATVTVAQSRFFLEAPRGDLEYAKLGRRTSECEVELVDLLRAC